MNFIEKIYCKFFDKFYMGQKISYSQCGEDLIVDFLLTWVLKIKNPNKNQSIFENLGLSYFKNAVEYTLSKISNPKFYIFSDDIKWAKDNFPVSSLNIVYVNESGILKDFEELILMSGCKHNITANSTFSWWGAWLNRNENKIVIQPKKWYKAASFQNAYELNQTLYSEKFIRI